MHIHRTACLVLLTAASLALPSVARTNNRPTPSPAPTPTPMPRTLGEAVPELRLDRVKGAGEGDSVVITNADLERLAAEGRLITASVPTADGAQTAGSEESTDPAVRRRWRKQYMKQRRRLRELQDDLERARSELHEVRRAFPSVRNRARKERLEEDIERLGERIDREREALNSIIREARKEGAQPGWFR